MISIGKTSRQIRKTLLSPHFGNSIWNVVDVAIYPVVMILTLRLFMERLGEQQYGIWILVNSLLASLNMANIGFGEATVRYVAKYRAEGDKAGVKGVVEASISVYIIIGVVIGMLSLLSAEILGQFDLYRKYEISDANKEIVNMALRIGGITFGIKLVEQIVQAGFRGFDKYEYISRISILAKTTLLGLNIALVYLGYNLIQIFINNLIISSAFLILEFLLLRRYIPKLAAFNLFKNSYLKVIAPYSTWSWVQSIMGVIGGQLDKIIVGRLAGVNLLGYYSNAALISERGLSLLAAGAGFAFPIVAKKTAKNEPILKMFRKMQFIMVTVAILAVIAGLILQKPILGYIWKEKYPPIEPFIGPFLILMGLMATTIVPNYFMQGSGEARISFLMRLNTLILQLILVPLSYYYLGPIGLPIGLIVMVLLAVPISFSLLAKYVLKTDILPFILSQASLPLVCTLIYFAPGIEVKMLLAFMGFAIWFLYFFKPIQQFLK